MLRKLTKTDFKGPYDCVQALYNGNSRYLNHGQKYYVTYNEHSDKATVQQSYNPGMHTNGGVQFSLRTFLVEEEDNMVNFADLSMEDQERLLKQARQQVEDEIIAKDSAAMYKLKKKDKTDECLNAIYNAYHMNRDVDKHAIRQRFVNTVQYLYKVKAIGKQYCNASTNFVIRNAEEFALYEKVCDIIMEAMIKVAKEV